MFGQATEISGKTHPLLAGGTKTPAHCSGVSEQGNEWSADVQFHPYSAARMRVGQSKIRVLDPGGLAASAHGREVSVQRTEIIRGRVVPPLFCSEDTVETLRGMSSGPRWSHSFGSRQRGIRELKWSADVQCHQYSAARVRVGQSQVRVLDLDDLAAVGGIPVEFKRFLVQLEEAHPPWTGFKNDLCL